MTERQCTILLEPNPEDGIYTVSVPALPGCITQGATVEEAIERAKEAIALHLEDRIACGEPIPEETERPRPVVVSVAA